MQSVATDKLSGLQVGRAIAALAVVIFHAQLTLIRFPEDSYIRLPYLYSHGDIGVPFFFVISGFIIAYVLERPSHSTLGFLTKRAFRLWPLYAFCTLLYVAIYLVHRNLPAGQIGYDAGYILQSLFFWPMGPLPALHPGWSLEHEVLFYILAAVVGMFWRARGLLVALVALTTIGFVWRVFGPDIGIPRLGWDWHLLAPVNLCFPAGVGLYLIWRHRKPVSPWIWIAFGGAGLVVWPYLHDAMAAMQVGPGAISGRYLKIALEALFSAVTLYGLIGLPATSRPAKALVWVGDRSYSLYLVHFSFIPVFQNIHREYVRWPEWMAEPLCVAFVVLSVGAAALVYWCVELPTANYGSKLARRVQKHSKPDRALMAG